MKIRTLLMAASATALLASPAYAACEDRVTDLQQQIEDASFNQDRQQKLEDKLAEARNALDNDNEAQCQDIIASVESDLRIQQMARADAETEAGAAGVVGSSQAETDLSRELPQPDRYQNQQAEVDIQQAEPEVNVEQVGEPEITYKGFEEEQDAGMETEAQADAGLDADAEMDAQADAAIAAGEADMAEPDILTVSDIKGQTARSIDGNELGEIENIVRDPGTGEIYVVVSSGGFLGFGAEETAVPFSRVDMSADELTLDLADKTELETYSRYEEDRYVALEDEEILSQLQLQ